MIPEGNRNDRVWAVVSCIPAGCVVTYGEVAAMAGIAGPSAARQVGYALAALGDDSEVPWHRVINSRGRISPRGVPGAEVEQSDRLALEGVECDAQGHIDLARYAWHHER